MTPKFYDLLNKNKQLQLTRLKRVLQNGSPKYHYDVPAAIAAGAWVEFDINTQFPASRKYAPLDSAFISNNDVVPLTLTFNGAGGDIFVIPANSTRQFNPSDIGGITSIRITNSGGVITVVNTIDIEFYRSAETEDSSLRKSL